jgi:hypothetical protein
MARTRYQRETPLPRDLSDAAKEARAAWQSAKRVAQSLWEEWEDTGVEDDLNAWQFAQDVSGACFRAYYELAHGRGN